MDLRVAHIISGLGIGGAERHLVNLLNTMSCEYRVAVFLGGKPAGPSFHGDLDPSVEQHFLGARRRNFPLAVFKLAAFLKSRRINVAHSHMFGANLYGCLAAKIAGVPVVVTTEHGENPWKRPVHRWLERRVVSPIADERFCVSPQILALRRDKDGIPAAKLSLTVNGTLVPALPEHKEPNPVPVIGAVGRFIPAKHYPGLLQAVAELRRRGRELELCLVGDGPEMASIRSMIQQLGLSAVVRLPGLVTDIGRWYRRFDIYASSSIREGQPLALLEAMAYGLPVVATDVGASAETVRHGVGGLIVPPGDAAALADSLDALLDDGELRRTLGANARARVESTYSVQAVASAYLDSYSEILSRKQTLHVRRTS
jgi:L-malate glycosyltransferase